MINILFLISGIIFFNITGYSQKYEPFIGENKQWRYHKAYTLTSGGKVDFVDLGLFRGDTILNDTTFSKFYMLMEQPFMQNETLPYSFREDTIEKQVWVHDFKFNKTALLYDFKLTIGDTFNIYIVNDIFMRQTVTDVDTFYTENKKLKRIVFDDSTTWIECIGSITQGIIPSEGELLCYRENGEELYINPRYNNCDTVFENGPSDNIKNNNYKNLLNSYVYPNPIVSISNIKIESNLNEECEIEIYNNLGVLIMKGKFINDYPVGSLNLRKGTYIYRIVNKKGIIGLNKIIVL
jgi:hypothetical protein